ncbi:MAG: cation:proton antiporter [Bacteroidales bacterium]|nr:cation:proton antiporter [Bacteroidales bacterium]
MLSKRPFYLFAIALCFFFMYEMGKLFPQFIQQFQNREDYHIILPFFSVSFLLIAAFITLYAAVEVKLPGFVVAIFIGILSKPLFMPIIGDSDMLFIIISLGAALILFGGGLETEFRNFKKIFLKIFALAFPGVIITAFLFSISLLFVSAAVGMTISIATAVLLGALLSSTDPAAIIPVLKELKFKNGLTKDIVVSESAMNDVTGSLLTLVFISIALTVPNFTSVSSWFGTLFSEHGGEVLLKQFMFGVIFGFIGFLALYILKKIKIVYRKEFHGDIVFFIFVPIMIFTLSLLFEGSGFLAAFIAGLLFSMTDDLHLSEGFYVNVTDGFFKPIIFILLGALVDFNDLFNYAGIGLLISFVFMLILRPLVVFVTLGVFTKIGGNRLTINELLFISFVRETGAIPAVMLVMISTKAIPGVEGLVPIGMWVILSTLIFQPLLTPWVCKKLKVAVPIKAKSKM